MFKTFKNKNNAIKMKCQTTICRKYHESILLKKEQETTINKKYREFNQEKLMKKLKEVHKRLN